jgi:hypothetical protein
VRADDGVNAASATSPVFVSAGAPPIVRVSAPTTATTIRADAPLLLMGEAYDDTNAKLTGRRLRWYAGRRQIGTGPAATAIASVPAGRRTIRLVATDKHGRKSSRSVRVTILPVRPVVIALKAPGRVGSKARTVKLRVTANVASRLRVGAQRFGVSRRAKAITVKLPRKGARITLKLQLGSGKYASTTLVPIARG